MVFLSKKPFSVHPKKHLGRGILTEISAEGSPAFCARRKRIRQGISAVDVLTWAVLIAGGRRA